MVTDQQTEQQTDPLLPAQQEVIRLLFNLITKQKGELKELKEMSFVAWLKEKALCDGFSGDICDYLLGKLECLVPPSEHFIFDDLFRLQDMIVPIAGSVLMTRDGKGTLSFTVGKMQNHEEWQVYSLIKKFAFLAACYGCEGFNTDFRIKNWGFLKEVMDNIFDEFAASLNKLVFKMYDVVIGHKKITYWFMPHRQIASNLKEGLKDIHLEVIDRSTLVVMGRRRIEQIPDSSTSSSLVSEDALEGTKNKGNTPPISSERACSATPPPTSPSPKQPMEGEELVVFRRQKPKNKTSSGSSRKGADTTPPPISPSPEQPKARPIKEVLLENFDKIGHDPSLKAVHGALRDIFFNKIGKNPDEVQVGLAEIFIANASHLFEKCTEALDGETDTVKKALQEKLSTFLLEFVRNVNFFKQDESKTIDDFFVSFNNLKDIFKHVKNEALSFCDAVFSKLDTLSVSLLDLVTKNIDAINDIYSSSELVNIRSSIQEKYIQEFRKRGEGEWNVTGICKFLEGVFTIYRGYQFCTLHVCLESLAGFFTKIPGPIDERAEVSQKLLAKKAAASQLKFASDVPKFFANVESFKELLLSKGISEFPDFSDFHITTIEDVQKVLVDFIVSHKLLTIKALDDPFWGFDLTGDYRSLLEYVTKFSQESFPYDKDFLKKVCEIDRVNNAFEEGKRIKTLRERFQTPIFGANVCLQATAAAATAAAAGSDKDEQVITWSLIAFYDDIILKILFPRDEDFAKYTFKNLVQNRIEITSDIVANYIKEKLFPGTEGNKQKEELASKIAELVVFASKVARGGEVEEANFNKCIDELCSICRALLSAPSLSPSLCGVCMEFLAVIDRYKRQEYKNCYDFTQVVLPTVVKQYDAWSMPPSFAQLNINELSTQTSCFMTEIVGYGKGQTRGVTGKRVVKSDGKEDSEFVKLDGTENSELKATHKKVLESSFLFSLIVDGKVVDRRIPSCQCKDAKFEVKIVIDTTKPVNDAVKVTITDQTASLIFEFDYNPRSGFETAYETLQKAIKDEKTTLEMWRLCLSRASAYLGERKNNGDLIVDTRVKIVKLVFSWFWTVFEEAFSNNDFETIEFFLCELMKYDSIEPISRESLIMRGELLNFDGVLTKIRGPLDRSESPVEGPGLRESKAKEGKLLSFDELLTGEKDSRAQSGASTESIREQFKTLIRLFSGEAFSKSNPKQMKYRVLALSTGFADDFPLVALNFDGSTRCMHIIDALPLNGFVSKKEKLLRTERDQVDNLLFNLQIYFRFSRFSPEELATLLKNMSGENGKKFLDTAKPNKIRAFFGAVATALFSGASTSSAAVPRGLHGKNLDEFIPYPSMDVLRSGYETESTSSTLVPSGSREAESSLNTGDLREHYKKDWDNVIPSILDGLQTMREMINEKFEEHLGTLRKEEKKQREQEKQRKKEEEQREQTKQSDKTDQFGSSVPLWNGTRGWGG